MSRGWWDFESQMSVVHFRPLAWRPAVLCIISVSIFMFCVSAPPHTDIHPHFLFSFLLSWFLYSFRFSAQMPPHPASILAPQRTLGARVNHASQMKIDEIPLKRAALWLWRVSFVWPLRVAEEIHSDTCWGCNEWSGHGVRPQKPIRICHTLFHSRSSIEAQKKKKKVQIVFFVFQATKRMIKLLFD